MVITVDDYAEIRRRYLAGESQRSIAKSLGISRNTVAKYCDGSTVPWDKKPRIRQPSVVTDDVTAFIMECLEEDRACGNPKQQHTARRIYERLVEEKGFTGGESSIRRKVREIKAEMPKAYIPLSFDPGEAMQIDWGETYAYILGQKELVNLFCARLCYSCRPVVLAYHRQDQESFCDAIVRTLETIGGVPSRVIFDNGKVAVKSGAGPHAVMQDSYAALSAHYGFKADFCNPAEGHEKGLVEGLVGWSRRNICVPIPRVNSIDELNGLLLSRCSKYEDHKVQSRPATVGEMFHEEQRYLHELPVKRFETASSLTARVNAFSAVRFRTNAYSVPVRYVGQKVSVKGYPEKIEVYYKGDLISTHERLMGRNQASYHLEDYLPLLLERPRAVFDAAPVKQNIPYEVLQELKGKDATNEKIISILKGYAEKPSRNKANDPVQVKPADLLQYDALGIGKEG